MYIITVSLNTQTQPKMINARKLVNTIILKILQ